MNKLFNWTVGSIFRTFGRIIAYLLMGALFGLFISKSGLKITDLLGIGTIKAAEITPLEVKKFYVADVTDSIINPDQQWSSAIDWGTEYNRTSETSLFLRSVRVRAGYSSKFLKGVTYKFRINVIFSNSTNGQFYKLPDNIICQGSGTSSWSSDIDLLSSCKFVGREFYNNKANASYIFEFVPSADIYGVQIAWYYKLPVYGNYDMYFANVGKIRVLNSSKITYDNSTNEAINSMSDNITINQNKNTEQIINNNNENTENIINNQNELLGNQCPNLFDYKTAIIRNGYLVEGGSIMDIHSLGNNRMIFLKVEPGQTYTITRKIKTGTFRASSYNSIPSMTSTPIDYTVQSVYTNNNGDKITYTPQYKYLIIHYGHIVNDSSNIEESFKSIMVVKGTTSKPFCEFGSYQSKLDDTNQSINELKDAITDSSSPSINGLSNDTVAGWLPAGPVDSILNLPLTLINSLINGMSGSCAPLRVPLPYVNLELPIPCMSTVYTEMGFGTFFNWVGNIAAAFILFRYLLKLYKYVDDTLTFRENNFIDNWSGV